MINGGMHTVTSYCAELPSFDNGKIIYSKRKELFVATYECNSGLALRGNNQKTCSSQGIWMGQISPCGR